MGATRLAHQVIVHEIDQKREQGWSSDFTRRFDRALQRVAERIGGGHQCLSKFIVYGADIMAVWSDLERVFFPQWFLWVLEECEREGITIEQLKIELKQKGVS